MSNIIRDNLIVDVLQGCIGFSTPEMNIMATYGFLIKVLNGVFSPQDIFLTCVCLIIHDRFCTMLFKQFITSFIGKHYAVALHLHYFFSLRVFNIWRKHVRRQT